MSQETTTYNNYSFELDSKTKHLLTLQLEAKTLYLAPEMRGAFEVFFAPYFKEDKS